MYTRRGFAITNDGWYSAVDNSTYYSLCYADTFQIAIPRDSRMTIQHDRGHLK